MTKRMRILVDVQPMAAKNKAGIGYYTAGLVEAIAKSDPNDVEIICHYFNFLGRSIPELPNAPNIHYRVSRFIPVQIINRLRRIGINIPFEFLVKARGSIIIYPASTGPPSLFKTPIVPVVHDLAYLDLPEQVSKRKQQDMQRFMPKILKKTPFVITISQASADAIKKHYPWYSKPILVEHIPPQPFKKPVKEISDKVLRSLKIDKPYILFVGTIEPRKNIVKLAEAYSLLSAKLKDQYSLVLAGGAGWHDEQIRQNLNQLINSGANIIETGYISDEQKAVLYSEATVLVLPSTYEGYGMPILEAMMAKLPVAVSDIAVFREIAGPAAVYFNPQDSESITEAITKMLTSKDLRNKLAEAGQKLAKELSWQKVAANALKSLESCVK